eukprot:356139-Chlamydomonas_euryale.AAC.4
MDKWMDRWINGWIDGWMDGQGEGMFPRDEERAATTLLSTTPSSYLQPSQLAPDMSTPDSTLVSSTAPLNSQPRTSTTASAMPPPLASIENLARVDANCAVGAGGQRLGRSQGKIYS